MIQHKGWRIHIVPSGYNIEARHESGKRAPILGGPYETEDLALKAIKGRIDRDQMAELEAEGVAPV